MTAQQLKYYRRHSPFAHLAFWWAAVRSRSGARRMALLNRQKDYMALQHRPDLLPLHYELNQQLWAAHRQWPSHDYGASYFYQSCAELGIRGLRHTEARVAAMRLDTRLQGQRVLEIGCNTGFLSLAMARSAGEVSAFDINPHLITIARRAAGFLNVNNVRFWTGAFEELQAREPVDTVVSFANHCTFDGNTLQPLQAYFQRCWALLAPGGVLLFESHAPAYEGDSLATVMATLEEWFEIEQRQILRQGSFLDQGRTFVVARRRALGDHP